MNVKFNSVDNTKLKIERSQKLCLLIVCYLPEDICTAAVSIASVSNIDTKLKLLRTQNLDKWVFMLLYFISLLAVVDKYKVLVLLLVIFKPF